MDFRKGLFNQPWESGGLWFSQCSLNQINPLFRLRAKLFENVENLSGWGYNREALNVKRVIFMKIKEAFCVVGDALVTAALCSAPVVAGFSLVRMGASSASFSYGLSTIGLLGSSLLAAFLSTKVSDGYLPRLKQEKLSEGGARAVNRLSQFKKVASWTGAAGVGISFVLNHVNEIARGSSDGGTGLIAVLGLGACGGVLCGLSCIGKKLPKVSAAPSQPA